ncbi:DUF6884 domain-containing protein, partial [Frankia tisae]
MAAVADLVLIGCVKSKSVQPARAAELFTGTLFEGRRAFAQASGLPWYILSAKYGVLAPGDVIGPYDMHLADQPRAYRRAWGEFVCARLAVLHGDLAGQTIEVHAGGAYVDPLHVPLEKLGARLTNPTEHLGLGQQHAWYKSQTSPTDDPTAADQPASEMGALTAALTDQTRARTPAEFLAVGRAGFNRPGLYSWWVDEAGAGDLVAGLGMTFAPGLIYAGQAGATRWPSGRRSTSTPWARIAGMHLGGRAEFSTFRRTLSAALRDMISLDGEGTQRLDAWIGRHLRVIAVAVDDADELGRLEDAVLATLDPPLNLRGRPTTALRARLSERRGSRTSRDDDEDDASPGEGPGGGARETAASASTGTYREADGAKVDFATARAAWAEAARDVLISVAGRYHAVTTYGELAEDVQRASGIRTTMLQMHWIGGVLGRVAEDCGSRGEPLLSALCVQKEEGIVGEGYAGAVEAVRGHRPEDPDQHAAEERLACHRHFGATLPPDGGRPALTRQVAARRDRQNRAQP